MTRDEIAEIETYAAERVADFDRAGWTRAEIVRPYRVPSGDPAAIRLRAEIERYAEFAETGIDPDR